MRNYRYMILNSIFYESDDDVNEMNRLCLRGRHVVKEFFKVNQKLYQRCFRYEIKLLKSTKFTHGKHVLAIFLVVKIMHADLYSFFLDKLTCWLMILLFYADSRNSRVIEICFFRHQHDAKRRRSYRHIVQLKRYNGWNANYRCDLLARNSWLIKDENGNTEETWAISVPANTCLRFIAGISSSFILLLF